MARRKSVQNTTHGIKCLVANSDIVTIDSPAYSNVNGLSVEFEFKTPSSPTSMMSIYSEGNSGNTFPFWLLVWDAVTSNLEIQKRSDIGGQFANPIFTGFNFVPGKDYHVAVVDDLAAKAAKLYVNGSLKQTVVYGGVFGDITLDRSAINAFRRTTDASFGSHTYYKLRTFNGTPLTADQVADLYYDNIVPAGVVDSFLMEEGSSNTTTSEQSTAATITSPATWVTDTPNKRRKSPKNITHSILTTTTATNEVNFSNDSSLVLDGDFSIAVWLQGNNLLQTANSHGIFGKRTDASNREFTCFYQGSDNTILFKVSTTGGSASTPITTSGNELLDNLWYRLVVTRSGDNFTMYLNGNIIQTGTASTVIGDTSANVTLGSWAADGGNNWEGYLTKFHINKGYAWSSADVEADYYDDIQSTSGTIVLDAKMTDGVGSTATDSSASSNNGTLEGAAAWSTKTP